MIVFGLVATIAAGKDEVSKYLQSKGFYEIHTGSSGIAKEMVEKAGLEFNRENLTKVMNEYRQKFGEDATSRLIVKKIYESGKDSVIVNSLRLISDYNVLKSEYGEAFKVVLVDAPVEIRANRIIKRARPGDPKTVEEFRKQEESELRSFDFYKIKEKVDIIVENPFNTFEELHAETQKKLGRWIK